MKMAEIIRAIPAIRSLAEKEVTIQIAYDISKILRAIQPEEEFFNEEKNKLGVEYGELSDDELTYEIKKEHIPLVNKKLNELSNTEVLVSFEPVVLYLDDNLALSAYDILDLGNFVKIKDRSEEEHETLFSGD